MITKAKIFVLVGTGIDDGEGGSGFGVDVGKVVEEGSDSWR